MKSPLAYFRSSFVFTLFCVAIGYGLGGWQAAWIVLVLAVLETSLSFDNAVVNATVLKDMDPLWRKRFLVWGMAIAVFGMRLVFPLLIVAVIAGIGPVAVVEMAVQRPAEYSAVLTSAHHEIAAFGGTFLMMVALKFFVDEHKDEHWLRVLEKPLTRLGRMEAIQVALTLLVLLAVSTRIGGAEKLEFVLAGLWGLITYVFADGIGAFLGGEEGEAGASMAKQGFAGFMYLELLDASFSFDGVIGAFALSNNLFIIAAGLGAGAMFVRSFTLYLVDKGTLNQYRYLEHGAFWAIAALAVIMFLGVTVHIPEAVTGLIGAAFIVVALLSSVLANRKDGQDE